MKISREKIKSEYRKDLKDYHKDINNLDAEDRANAIEYAKMYYSYLATNDIPYAKLALDVIENKGKFGQIANIHLKTQSIFAGIENEKIAEVREKIIISLASHDAKMRSNQEYKQNNPYYSQIETYHIKVFKYHTTPYAWGGLALKELIGSGSWMEFYEKDKGAYDAISQITQNEKICQSSEYSVELMLQSVRHSYMAFTLGIDKPFELKMTAASKEHSAKIWKINPARIIELEEDTSMLDNQSSKVFKVLATNHFIPSGEADYSSSDSDNDDSPQAFGANKAINKQMKQLFSNKEKLKEYQEESLNEALKDLELAESIVPNIYKYSVESMNTNKEFMEQLMGKTNSSEILEKVEQSEEEMSELEPNIKGFDESVKTSHNYKNEMKAETPSIDWLTLLSESAKYIETMNSDPEMQDFMNSLSGAHKLFDNDDV